MQANNNNLAKIHAVIGRARRRLRLQAAFEWATTAAILAIAGGLIVLWLFRMQVVAREDAILILSGLGGSIVLAAIVGTIRRWPTHVVASRIDRASGLADRLGTACEFDRRLREQGGEVHPETAAMMQAAITDGINNANKASAKLAAPFKAPRDLRAFLAFTVVAAAIAVLAFKPTIKSPIGIAGLAIGPHMNDPLGKKTAPEDEKGLDHDDMESTREYVDDLKNMAEQTGDRYLQEFANDLEKLLEKAERGDISKEELLAEMEKLEKKYMEGSDQNLDEIMKDLKESGKELKQEPMTRRLGEALEEGNMEAAKQELERLADEMEKGNLTPQQQKKIADALEKAEKKRDQREEKKDEKDPKNAEIKQKKDEVKRLEKKVKDKPNDEESKRRLEKNKRELEKLERDQKEKKEEQAKKRRLERLHRDLKKTAEDLKDKKEQAPRTMRESADDAQGVEDEIRKIQNQQKAQSQLGDLKEAIRRAKPKKGNGQGQGQGRAQRIKDYAKRAGGQGGQGQKPGQGQGQGQGKNGKGNQPGQGGELGGNSYGDEHDPNLMGDPTKMNGKTKSEQLTGQKGKGAGRKQTILTSAKQGFASVKYKEIYTQYKKVAEDVMAQEKVPQGYKYFVKRYFQRIKPHNMD